MCSIINIIDGRFLQSSLLTVEGRLTDTAEGWMTDVVLVTTPTGLVTVRTKVALGTELRTPGGRGGWGSDQITEILSRLDTT